MKQHPVTWCAVVVPHDCELGIVEFLVFTLYLRVGTDGRPDRKTVHPFIDLSGVSIYQTSIPKHYYQTALPSRI